MKSLIKLINTTQQDIVRFGVTFAPGAPVGVYRNKNFFVVGEEFGKLVNDVAAGEIVGYCFDGDANTPAETLEAMNALANEWLNYSGYGTYSPEYHWKRAACQDLLDGLRRQLLLFDFGAAGVTKTRPETLEKMVSVVTYLNAGFLDLSIGMIDTITPDTDDDFLSAECIANYRALFVSANS